MVKVEVELTESVIAPGVEFCRDLRGQYGSVVEFSGMVREVERGERISTLNYQAYVGMAEKVFREIIERLAMQHPVMAVKVIHRIGKVPVGDAAIYLAVVSQHRAEGFHFVTEFMSVVKQEVPIWKVDSDPVHDESC